MADINARTRLLVGTTAAWAASDLVLGDGEMVLERAGNQVKMKAGNGADHYSALPFISVPTTTGKYRGTTNATAAVPAGTYIAGDYYINTGSGNAHASWGLPANTPVTPGQQLVNNGAQWDLIGSGATTLVRLGDGSAAAPSLAFANDLGVGLWRPGPGVLGFAAGGLDKARLLNNAGDAQWLVGVTTSTNGAAGRGVVEINGTGASFLGLDIGGVTWGYLYASGQNFNVQATAGKNVALGVGGSTALLIDPNNVATCAGNEIGWRDVPQNSQTGAAYTAVTADRGKTVVMGGAGGAIFTIPQPGAGGAVGMAPGCVVTVINVSSNQGTISLQRNGGTTALVWGTGPGRLEGNRTLAYAGVATFYLLSGATWLLSGTGIS